MIKKFKYHLDRIHKICISAYLHIGTSAPALVVMLMLTSCAQVLAPGGGTKDETPPRVLKYSPDSAHLNFNAKTIEIEFDEFITLKELSNQLLISPPLAKAPEVGVKNKTLTIELDKNEVLKPNTTYCISFGTAVQDLNEGNVLDNFKYIFSTGTFIDSLKLTGKVQNAFNQSTEKGITVMLYSDQSDSVVYKSQPDYFAKTLADGSFQINNIRAGKYKLVAIKDVNANYRYDGDSEVIGYSDTIVDASSKEKLLLELFQEPAKKVYLKKYIYDSYGKVTFYFNQGTDSLRISALNNDQKGVQEYVHYSDNLDTVIYWIKNFMKDSLILQVNNGSTVLDTVSLKFTGKEEALKSKKHPLKLKVISSPDGNQGFELGSALNIRMSNQLLTDTVSIFEAILKEDSISRPAIIEIRGSTLSLVALGDSAQYEDPYDPAGGLKTVAYYEPFRKWKESTKYELLILPNSFVDFFGLTNDTIKVKFKTREEKYYGSVKLKLHLPPGRDFKYLLQLQDESGKIIREDDVREEYQELNYNYLAPKKYKLKMIMDLDFDGKWTPGNYLKKIQPEPVFYNSELILIRSNWDAELEWKIAGGMGY